MNSPIARIGKLATVLSVSRDRFSARTPNSFTMETSGNSHLETSHLRGRTVGFYGTGDVYERATLGRVRILDAPQKSRVNAESPSVED
jgi:hypothetical protein